ncbi:MAG: hypothetical protein ACJAVO_002788 [Parvibaculaceae bacterium]|jgi:hypothetical protein|nr:hypothetical protein [Parvibaculaceae bacterium]
MSSIANLEPLVLEQLQSLSLDPARPLIISDADEVLLKFVAGLETYLQGRDMWLDLQSFALSGNIKRKNTNEIIATEEVPDLLSDFFAAATGDLEAVTGAADALAALHKRGAQIIVLTNVPHAQRHVRQECLARQGLDYPVIANQGLKGPAVTYLAQQCEGPFFFLDDIPHNIASVAKAHAPTKCIHFIADKRLAQLIDPAKDSQIQSSSWPHTHAYIENELAQLGH